MQIYNVRFGFATNSSSSHSVVLMPHGVQFHDKIIDEQGYGWENFTLASTGAKEDYLAQALLENLSAQVGVDLAQRLVGTWFPAFHAHEYGIDHASVPTLPLAWDGHGIDAEYLAAVRAFLARPDIAILGGNDNDNDHPLKGIGKELSPWLTEDLYIENGGWVARHEGDIWTLFNRSNGNKVRFAFTDMPVEWSSHFGKELVTAPRKYLRPSAPELVDIRINSACTRNCSYCYANATPDGRYAEDGTVYNILAALSKLRVFEVALGGGEPTTDPHLTTYLFWARHLGIVPNFTTAATAWLRDPILLSEIIKNVGAVGFSAESPTAALEFLQEACRVNFPISKIKIMAIPVVLGAHLGELLSLCHTYRIGVVLLGFKQCGRGATYVSNNDEQLQRAWDSLSWLCKATHYGLPEISMDTLLVEQWRKHLDGLKVPFVLRAAREGEISCYIDALDNKMAAASYAGTAYPINLESDNLSEAIHKVWQEDIAVLEEGLNE